MSLEIHYNDEQSRQVFAQIAFKHQLEGEKRRVEWNDEETPEQSVIRMTLQYVTDGLMNWEQATQLLKLVFEEGCDD